MPACRDGSGVHFHDLLEPFQGPLGIVQAQLEISRAFQGPQEEAGQGHGDRYGMLDLVPGEGAPIGGQPQLGCRHGDDPLGDDEGLRVAVAIEGVAIQGDQHGQMLGFQKIGPQQAVFRRRLAVLPRRLCQWLFDLPAQLLLEIQLFAIEIQ